MPIRPSARSAESNICRRFEVTSVAADNSSSVAGCRPIRVNRSRSSAATRAFEAMKPYPIRQTSRTSLIKSIAWLRRLKAGIPAPPRRLMPEATLGCDDLRHVKRRGDARAHIYGRGEADAATTTVIGRKRRLPAGKSSFAPDEAQPAAVYRPFDLHVPEQTLVRAFPMRCLLEPYRVPQITAKLPGSARRRALPHC